MLSVQANRNPQLLSAKIVNDVYTKTLGALPTASGGLLGLPMHAPGWAGIELMPLLKIACTADFDPLETLVNGSYRTSCQ